MRARRGSRAAFHRPARLLRVRQTIYDDRSRREDLDGARAPDMQQSNDGLRHGRGHCTTRHGSAGTRTGARSTARLPSAQGHGTDVRHGGTAQSRVDDDDVTDDDDVDDDDVEHNDVVVDGVVDVERAHCAGSVHDVGGGGMGGGGMHLLLIRRSG
jgi:hypothetical protein